MAVARTAACVLKKARPCVDKHHVMDAVREESLVAASRRRERQSLFGRARLVEVTSGIGFLIVAGVLAQATPTDRSPSLLIVALFVAAFAASSLVEFEVGGGNAVPTQLVLVPMLFVLPTGWVPLAAASGYLLAHLVNVRRRNASLDRAVVMLGSSWYAIGPALVLGLAGEPAPSFARWGLFVVAFGVQIAMDGVSAFLSEWAAHGTSPRVLAPFLLGCYLVDAILAPTALCVAIAANGHPIAGLLALPVVGLFAYFASERRHRIDHALELSHAYRETARLLSDLVEYDDAYTGSHSRSVRELVLAVADELGLDDAERSDAELTALLHDIGKIAIPKSIINKPGPLDPSEWALIESHTVEGEAILQRVGGVLGRVGSHVRSCHERWDGKGYPDGLAGDQITIVARIVCACDAYNAITTARPYRPARSMADALREIRACAGSQFDPAVVAALVVVAPASASDALANAA